MQAAHDPTGMAEDPPASIQKNHGNGNTSSSLEVRRERPKRTCTARSAARLHAAAAAEAEETARERRRKAGRRRERVREEEPEREPTPPPEPQCKIITQLVGHPPLSQAPRWGLRSMWELASVLNFLNVFRPLLNIKVEFSVEELETALITPNQTLADLHIPLLKAIPPIARMALGRNTWITVLCRKLRDWWYWVAEGELPIIASHGTEFEVYNKLDPGVRVIILKAICDIRVEQEDIRNYIDDSIKRGIHLSTFRKERVGGDSYGISYWYEDDPIIGHRLYREIRKADGKKAKGKNAQPLPNSSYQWETVATNLDDFLDVSEKLFSSKNRTEASLGKKLKSDMLPEIEEVHKRKARLLKKQQREALLLDNVMHMDGFGPGRSLRGRKPVTYTFDDYDRSINEAIKINKNKPPSPDSIMGRENAAQTDASMDAYMNGRLNSTGQSPQEAAFDSPSPMSSDYDDEENKDELVDRSNRRRQRSQRYSAREYVDAISDNDDAISDNDEADSDFEDDIVGEAVYDDEYLRQRKRKRKMSSGSEGDEEYNWDDENLDDEEEDDDDNSLSTSEDSDEPRKTKKLRGRPGKRMKSKSVSELQSGLRRSRRATRNRINYKQYEVSDSEADLAEHERSNASNEQTDTDHEDFSEESQNPEVEKENDEKEIIEQPVEEIPETIEEKVVQNLPPEKSNSSGEDEIEGVRKRRFLDLNELAPGSGFDDCPDTEMKDEDTDDF